MWCLCASIGFRVPQEGGIWVPPWATACPKWDLGAANGFGYPWEGSDCPKGEFWVVGFPEWYFGAPNGEIWVLSCNIGMLLWDLGPPRVTWVAPRGIWVPRMGALGAPHPRARTHLDVFLHHLLGGVTQKDIKIQNPPNGAVGDGRGGLHDELCKEKSQPPPPKINAIFLKSPNIGSSINSR